MRILSLSLSLSLSLFLSLSRMLLNTPNINRLLISLTMFFGCSVQLRAGSPRVDSSSNARTVACVRARARAHAWRTLSSNLSNIRRLSRGFLIIPRDSRTTGGNDRDGSAAHDALRVYARRKRGWLLSVGSCARDQLRISK